MAEDPVADDEFSDAIGELGDEFGGEGKSDFFGFDVEPCDVLEPLLPYGDDVVKMGFFGGIEGESVVGVGNVFGGFDVVWDLYHGQISVSKYFGAGVALPELSVAVQAYAGMAFGFEHGVADWDGYFVGATHAIGLPFIKDFFSLNPNFFVSGVDADNDSFIAPDEVLIPPDGVYGYSIGVTVGFDLAPDPLPLDAAITEGLWTPYVSGIRNLYDQLRGSYLIEIDARLVDQHDGTPCPEDWPETEPERECIIQLGEPDDSPLERSVDVALSICYVTGRCANPLSYPAALTAIGIGALNNYDMLPSELCGGSEDGHH